MVYKDFQNIKPSSLGMGAMRLPTVGSGSETQIDERATEKMVAYAVEHGVNYFDTAWGYHNGQSEIVLGKALSKYPRETWFLADKFPGYDLSNMGKVGQIFEEQLKRCGVDYFDFYLFHNVCEMNIDAYLDHQYNILNYLLKQKENRRIHHLGFSAHGSLDVMERFFEACGGNMEFCQIQLNYVDWFFQGAREKVELINKYHIPILVMEPMRGGQLATLSEENSGNLRKLRPEENISAWAFRFIQSIPNVIVTLTGVSNLDQLQENIAIYQKEKPLSQSEMDTLLRIGTRMVQRDTVPCTACRYCVGYCPQQLNIPNLLGLYNEHLFTVTRGGFSFIAPMALMAIPEERQPKACIACLKCEAVCPQKINISGIMANFVAKLGEDETASSTAVR
jgi:predicted aldo/keto reductase-like oxidoreductase